MQFQKVAIINFLFLSFQDEKNQLMTTNVWMKQASKAALAPSFIDSAFLSTFMKLPGKPVQLSLFGCSCILRVSCLHGMKRRPVCPTVGLFNLVGDISLTVLIYMSRLGAVPTHLPSHSPSSSSVSCQPYSWFWSSCLSNIL